ncbi:putative Pentatricopeptide repeat domain containing protein [Klebsormidium nitens]|uniref:Putative Pentatricopeptide repeat domain containing protein n=1 Tax=Klebsormidium nitens TaxID=105231 RepID=A0A1Y1I6R9_KLENI|nr:putative Pentatricopeptide repeat domain containing protein [Klebsormidium nitens]|eukprot:GAQ83798.1 putative Pentatricopeptide repeat domain containing protein [Klebsormidium nitens]
MAGSQTLLQSVGLCSPPCNLPSHHQIGRKALFQPSFSLGPHCGLRRRPRWSVQGPRAAILSPSELKSDSEPGNRPQVDRSARVTSKKAGGQVASGAVNGGRDDDASEAGDDVSGGSSDVKGAARRILEQLDNGLADVILDDGAGRPRGKRRGQGQRGLSAKSPSITPPQFLRPESSTSDSTGLSQDSETLILQDQQLEDRGSLEGSKTQVLASKGSEGEAESEWRRVADTGRLNFSDRTEAQLETKRGIAKRGSPTELEAELGSESDGVVVVEQGEERGQQPAGQGQQGRQLSSAERRAARKGTRENGVGAPGAAEPGSPLMSSDSGAEMLTSSLKSRSRVAPWAASTTELLSESQKNVPLRSQLPSQNPKRERNAEGDEAVADVSSRLLRAGEASTSGATNHRHASTAGTVRKDSPPHWRSARNRPPGAEDSSQGGRNGRPRGPWVKNQKSEVQEPLVLEAARALRDVGRDVGELESAVERIVPSGVIEKMNLEYWNEVIKLLARGGWCRQMEAVLAYLPRAGYEPDETTYARVFFGLHRHHRYEAALAVFNAMRESRHPPTTNMYNAAMSVVTKFSGDYPLVEALFEEMSVRGLQRDRISYSTMMDAVWRAGTRTVRGRKDKMKEATPRDRRNAADKVEALFERMVSEGLAPDTIAKNSVLNALVSSQAYSRAEELFAAMLDDARTPPNDRTFTMMMHMHSERNHQHKVQEVFDQMLAAGIPPTDITYNVLIKACVGTRNVREAIRLYREMTAKELPVTSCTYNSLVEVLATAGYFTQAEEVIYGMEIKGVEPSPEPYNMLITGLIRSKGCFCDEAMRIFQAMQLARVKPWALTYGALMEGFGKVGRLQEMEHMYRLMRYAKLQPTTTIFTAMIHAYIRADDLETSWELFAKMREVGLVPNVQTYTVLINGLASRGETDVIDDVFAEAKEELLELDAVIYESVLLAHVGQNNLPVEDRLCAEMKERGLAMLPHTYDKLAALHVNAGRHKRAEELAERKRLAYPDLEERKRAATYGWLRDGYDPAIHKEPRPLMLDDIWAALEGPEPSDESSLAPNSSIEVDSVSTDETLEHGAVD